MADLIQFDAGSGQRIADVVRIVESQFPHARPLNFDRVFSDAKKAKVFRICTFEGAWSTGTEKTVTFKFQDATPNTVSATNLFFPVQSTSTQDCAIAKDGTAWFLVDVPLETATAVFFSKPPEIQTAQVRVVSSVATQIVSIISDVEISASLNTTNCGIAIGKTVTGGAIVGISSVGTTHVQVISSIATGLTFTSSFLRLRL